MSLPLQTRRTQQTPHPIESIPFHPILSHPISSHLIPSHRVKSSQVRSGPVRRPQRRRNLNITGLPPHEYWTRTLTHARSTNRDKSKLSTFILSSTLSTPSWLPPALHPSFLPSIHTSAPPRLIRGPSSNPLNPSISKCSSSNQHT